MSELGQELHGTLTGRAPLGEAERAQLVAEHDVLCDGEPRDEVELLVHGGDARIHGRLGMRESDRPALPDDLPLVRLVHPCQHLDEGGLAGAVLAEQAVHLAGPHVEVHARQRDHAGEALHDAAHLE